MINHEQVRAWLVKKFLLIEPEDSLPCSQNYGLSPYPEAVASISHLYNIIEIPFIFLWFTYRSVIISFVLHCSNQNFECTCYFPIDAEIFVGFREINVGKSWGSCVMRHGIHSSKKNCNLEYIIQWIRISGKACFPLTLHHKRWSFKFRKWSLLELIWRDLQKFNLYSLLNLYNYNLLSIVFLEIIYLFVVSLTALLAVQTT